MLHIDVKLVNFVLFTVSGCPPDRYGVNCIATCKCVPGQGTCNSVTGHCTCYAGYAGSDCSQGEFM